MAWENVAHMIEKDYGGAGLFTTTNTEVNMDAKTLSEVLNKHKKWINNEDGGERAYLRGAYLRGAYLRGAYLRGADLSEADLSEAVLSGADLSGAYLRGAYLRGADLSEADLSGADLSGADLSGAYLRGADLRGADLSGADLSGADLRGADLSGAYLSGADLRGADLSGAYLRGETKGIKEETLKRFFPIACPEYGEFVGWKKSFEGLIVKLKITENAKRSSAFGRKCRCSEAVVLAIENVDGTPSDKTEVFSQYDRQFVYRVGKTVSVSDFDDDRKNECSPGIHFFITRQEAVDY